MRQYKELCKSKGFIINSVITIAALIIILIFFSRFLIYVEVRQGVVLDDPLFHLFSAINLNPIIFILIYGSIITAFITLLKYPEALLIAIQSYTLIMVFRALAMFIVPLDPPIGTIDLQDPLIFIVGTGRKITKDLFFSGHTSMLFLLFLTAKNKKLKYFFLIATVLVGSFVILQKVHYSIDVMVAPFFSYASYKIITYFYRKD